ncbi:MAG: hypothetical protein GC185_10585 [Alphaproteobacteria bacterium]|nr:hypothetical protein [Alphaproteobacteria bacterium]
MKKLVRAIVRFFVPYREFIDRCWDLTECKSRGKAIFIYLELLFIGVSFNYVAKFPFLETSAAYRLLHRFPPSLFIGVALTLWTIAMRKSMPLRAVLSLAVAVYGGYRFGAWVGLLPLIHLMQQPLRGEADNKEGKKGA